MPGMQTKPGPRALEPTVTEWDQWTTRMVVCVAGPDGGPADRTTTAAAATAVRQHLDAVDRACSRFRDDSELVLANDRSGETVTVSALLGGHLDAALQAASHTNGAVDPTLGGPLVACGYDVARGREGFRGEVGEVSTHSLTDPGVSGPTVTLRRRRDWRDVELLPCAEGWTVRVPAGVHLDLGATAKAKAADDACALAHAATGAPVLVSLGGDLAVAGTPAGRAWSVAVREVPSDAPAVISFEHGGLATSTVLLRRWTQGGIARHHLIDPLTGLPVEGRLRTATVAAGSCLAANTASTAVLVRPLGAAAWLHEVGLPARLVDRSGHVQRVGGWPQDEPGTDEDVAA